MTSRRLKQAEAAKMRWQDLRPIALPPPRLERTGEEDRVIYSVDLAETSGTYLFTWTLPSQDLTS